MKHYILAKLKDAGTGESLKGPVEELFRETLAIPGVHDVTVKTCCVDRANRYDLMIVIDMDRAALEEYDACEPHRKWKENYGSLLQAKAIFDSED